MTELPSSLISTPPGIGSISSRGKLRTYALALALFLLAGALRWHQLGERDIWVDEANGVLIAQESPSRLIERLKLDSSPPLYYFVLKGWMAAFGDSESAVRSLSALGGAVLAASVFVLGRRWFTTEVGILAALLIATSPIQIYYSQQARMYAWLPALALWSFHWLGRAVREDKIRHYVAAAVCTLAALYTHNYGLYLLPAQAVLVLATGALRRRPGRWCGYAVALAVLYLPWTPVLLEQLRNGTHYSWFTPFWKEYGTLGAAWATLQSFAPGGKQPLYVALRSAPTIAHWSTALVAGLFLLGVVAFIYTSSRRQTDADASKTRSGFTESGRTAAALYAVTLIPLLCALLASTIVTPNYVPGRCDQLVFGLFCLCVAVGLSIVRPWFLRYLIAAALLTFAAFGLRPLYSRPNVPSERALARDIAARAQGGDAVLCTSMTRAPLEYYRRRLQTPIVLYSFPRDTSEHLGNIDEATLLKDPERLRREAIEVARDIRAAHGPEARFFLVMEYLKGDRVQDNPVNRILYDEYLRGGLVRPLEIVGQYAQAGTGLPVTTMLLQLK